MYFLNNCNSHLSSRFRNFVWYMTAFGTRTISFSCWKDILESDTILTSQQEIQTWTYAFCKVCESFNSKTISGISLHQFHFIVMIGALYVLMRHNKSVVKRRRKRTHKQKCVAHNLMHLHVGASLRPQTSFLHLLGNFFSSARSSFHYSGLVKLQGGFFYWSHPEKF